MQPFISHTGIIAPLDRANIDTDAIIPKQYLKSIKRTGFGQFLFDDWRYIDQGNLETDIKSRLPNYDFILNQEPYNTATILVAKENFGCGSSREHAVWALMDFGFRAVIAPSFADIFYNNSLKNGLLPIVLNKEEINQIIKITLEQKTLEMSIDLTSQNVIYQDKTLHFAIDSTRKQYLLTGSDDIDVTLQYKEEIKLFELEHQRKYPWLFTEVHLLDQ